MDFSRGKEFLDSVSFLNPSNNASLYFSIHRLVNSIVTITRASGPLYVPPLCYGVARFLRILLALDARNKV